MVKARVSFLDLPGELRNQIYTEVLVRAKPFRVWKWKFQQKSLDLGILRANKQIYNEASAIFYSRNSFDVSVVPWLVLHRDIAMVKSFPKRIGAANAKQIRRLIIDQPFPSELDGLTVDSKTDVVLAMIQEHFVNLTTISTVLPMQHYDSQPFSLDNPDQSLHFPFLRIVDEKFRSIKSLRAIKFHKPLASCSRQSILEKSQRVFIESLGWEIQDGDRYIPE